MVSGDRAVFAVASVTGLSVMVGIISSRPSSGGGVGPACTIPY